MELKRTVMQDDGMGVEYPGLVRNVEAAISTLGGKPGVLKAATMSNSILPLHLRKGDATSHPIFGEKQTSRGLLLRINRHHLGGRAEIALKVSSLFRFPGMADFQAVADTTLHLQEELPVTGHQEGAPGDHNEPLLTLPPLFTRLDMPMDYHFRSFYGEDLPVFRGPGGAKTKGQLPAYVMKSISLGVPPAIQLPELVEGSFKPEKRELLKTLFSLFKERPMWSFHAVHERLTTHKPSLSELESSLPRLAYTFRSGPFRSLWIRRGYDPRLDSSSRKLHAVTYTLPSGWYELFTSKNDTEDDEDAVHEPSTLPPIAQSYSELASFSAVPKQQTILLQVSDIKDLLVSTVLQKESFSPSYDEVTGWLTSAELDRISKQVTTRFQAILDVASSQAPALPAEATGTLQTEGDKNAECNPANEPQNLADQQPKSHLQDAAQPRIVPEGVLVGLLANWEEQQNHDIDQRRHPVSSGALVDPDVFGGDEADAFEIFEDESEEDEEDESGVEDDEDEEDERDEDDSDEWNAGDGGP